MRERAVNFSDEEVRAVLAGRKSQFRRVLRPQPPDHVPRLRRSWTNHREWIDVDGSNWGNFCPFGTVGTRLWVREAWAPLYCDHGDGEPEVLYRATYGEGGTWKPSIFMPRWASRITLEVTGVRVERLQSISCGGDLVPSDVVREGFPFDGSGASAEMAWFAAQWNRTHAKHPQHSFASNPFVWVVEFERVEEGEP